MRLADERVPFVLLDDARPGGIARLYRRPQVVITTREPDEVRDCLDTLRDIGGQHAAGFISYEAGHVLEPKLTPLRVRPADDAPPLLWFGLFEAAETVNTAAVLPDPASAWTTRPRPLVERARYEACVARAIEHIFAGDIYQANISFPAEVLTAGPPLAVYAALRARARAGHGAVVWTGAHWLLSLSPELFFTLEQGRITARPMKGTALRDDDPRLDEAAAAALRADPKQRAENLMIVDLLRNDLARVSQPGSVAVPALFAVESYPTVHQLTSTVTGVLEDGLGPVDTIVASFPCGSITGAPKIRAMEVIAALEGAPRGVYTGAIGRIGPEGSADFNVAIRTLVIRDGENRAVIGLGSGIVADSRPGDEWRECLAKGAFVSDPARHFDLIETMRFDPLDGFALLDRHLARMKASADALGFAFDRHDARNDLQSATFRVRRPSTVRLLLSPSGATAIEVRALPAAPTGAVEVAIAPLPVDRHDFRLRHKTSDRRFYDQARRDAGAFEVLFEDPGGYLTEGSFTNLFVERDGRLLTPPLALGLLPGVLRAELIASGRAEEAELRATDLGGGFHIGNALRGLMPAVLLR